MKVPVEGGVPTVLCEIDSPFGASWGPDNRILFTKEGLTGLSAISAAGGSVETLTSIQTKEEYSHRLPHALPHGKGTLFTILNEAYDNEPCIAYLNFKTGKYQILQENGSDGRYLSTGHIAFIRQGILMVIPFDVHRGTVTGQPIPVISNIKQALNSDSTEDNTGAGQFSISETGNLVYIQGGIYPEKQNSLVWIDFKGKAQEITPIKAPYFAPRLSPDGSRIAYTTLGKNSRLWVYDLRRGSAIPLTHEGRSVWSTWATDGQKLFFRWNKNGVSDLYSQSADGSELMKPVFSSPVPKKPTSCTPDGKYLAFSEGFDLKLLDLQSYSVKPLLKSNARLQAPEISPDGQWMAYVSKESGQKEIYISSFPEPGARFMVSKGGGKEPLWSRDGKRLFYRSLDQKTAWAVEIQTKGRLNPSKPRLLFSWPEWDSGDSQRTWDISLDNKRFLMVKRGEVKPTSIKELILITHWFEEVKRLSNAGR